MGVARPATTTSAMSALEATTPSQIAGGKAARALPAFQTTCRDAPRKLAPSMVARFAVMALMVAVGYPQKSVRDRLDITPLHRHAPHTGMHTRARSHSFSLSLSLLISPPLPKSHRPYVFVSLSHTQVAGNTRVRTSLSGFLLLIIGSGERDKDRQTAKKGEQGGRKKKERGLPLLHCSGG